MSLHHLVQIGHGLEYYRYSIFQHNFHVDVAYFYLENIGREIEGMSLFGLGGVGVPFSISNGGLLVDAYGWISLAVQSRFIFYDPVVTN